MKNRVLCAPLIAIGLSFLILPAYAQLDQTPQEQAQAMTARAVEAFNEGRVGDAETQLQASLGVAENIYETHFWLGRVHATRAGSSAVAKAHSIEEFRRALELQPYGEDGDLARGWMIRISGRPKTILFAAAKHPTLNGNDNGATREVIEALQTKAEKSGFAVADAPRRAVDLQTNPRELAKACEDETGAIQAGWMVCVGVEKMQVERSDKLGYTSSGNARMWVFDPLTQHLYPPEAVGASSANLVSMLLGLKTKSSNDARQSSVGSLGETIWNKCRRIIALNVDPVVLDETSFPLALEGVYARAAVPYRDALKLPRVAVMKCLTPGVDADDGDAARVLGVQLQQSLMKSKRVAIISPGNMEDALTSLNFRPDNNNLTELSEAGRRSGCRYMILPSLTKFDIRSKGRVVYTKVYAEATLDLKILDTQTAQIAFTKIYSEKDSAKKFLAGEGTKTMIAKQSQALSKIGANATKDVLLFLAQHRDDASSLPLDPK